MSIPISPFITPITCPPPRNHKFVLYILTQLLFCKFVNLYHFLKLHI